MSPTVDMRPLRFRAIWISDVHLGTRGCRAEYLLDFLRSTESEYLYLMGDIVDLWAMRRGVFWPQTHNDVVRTILGKAKRGTKVIYVPGNHDAALRDFHGMSFGNVTIRREALHETADGRRLALLHGDELDSAVRCSRLISVLGSISYAVLILLGHWIHAARQRFGRSYWSLAGFLKCHMANAAGYIREFEKAAVYEAARRGVDGIVCGHIHRAELRDDAGHLYCNDGDWVENCTSLVERFDGSLQILHWSDRQTALQEMPGRLVEEPGKRVA